MGSKPLTRARSIYAWRLSHLSNSRKELREKIAAYLLAGAKEVWLAYPKSKRFEFYGEHGLLTKSGYPVDLTNLFA